MLPRYFPPRAILFTLILTIIAALSLIALPSSSKAQTIPGPTSAPVYLPLISNVIPTATPVPTITPTPTKTLIPATATALPTATKTPVPAREVTVLSSSIFRAYAGSSSYYLVGEVINNTGDNVRFAKINAVLRDSTGKIVDGNYSYTSVDTLSPGMKSGFLIIFSDPPSYQTYDLVVNWDTADSGPVELQISDQETYFDDSDAFHVKGSITNQSSGKRTFVRVFIVLYDVSNQVIGVEDDYLTPHDLDPGQKVSFDSYVYFWNGKPSRSKVDHYSVHSYDD